MARLLPFGAALMLLTAACGSDEPSSGGGAGPATSPFTPTPAVEASTTAASQAGGAASTAPAPPPSASAGPNLAEVRVALTEVGEFDQPVALVERQGTLYVAEKGGRVLALAGDEPVEVLDMRGRTESAGERGLLGMAFSADGGLLYVSYTNNDGDSRVDEYAVGAGPEGTADPGTRREVLALDQPYSNHNGGHVVFGPDGYLYLGYGDGGSAGDPERRALDPRTLLGKLLRIDPRPNGDQPYTIPPDNPFADGSAALPEIWSVGLRNPWRFSFDPETGDLWIGDVGQNAVEEIDLVTAEQGAGRAIDFGWSAYEGTDRYNEDQESPNHWPPIFEYRHADGGCSVTGGIVYRGEAIPALRGAYLLGDYCASGISALVAQDGQLVDSATISDEPGQIVSFGTDGAGEVYVVSIGGGVFRLDPA
jgi:glucose/arabinose dehydrogenase